MARQEHVWASLESRDKIWTVARVLPPVRGDLPPRARLRVTFKAPISEC